MRVPGRPARRSKRGGPNHGFRRETDLRRRPAGARQERRTVLIVTNGKRTEVDYFNALREEPWVTVHKVVVKFQPGDPRTAVHRAAAIRDDNEYDEAWAVCDVDEYDVQPAMKTARDRGVELTLSVPSFEVWLILHHKDGCPGFNTATHAGTHLRQLIPTWDKTALDFAHFREGVSKAVTRAQQLGEPPHANPSTAVWQLVEFLRSPTPRQ
jgi:hypothetical protein